jgi:hypothetical protein
MTVGWVIWRRTVGKGEGEGKGNDNDNDRDEIRGSFTTFRMTA